jgi:tetratricopeptide (TPR) repeat protein
MKKQLFPIFILGLSLVFGWVYHHYNQQKKQISAVPSRGKAQTVSLQSEWLNAKSAIESLQNQIRRQPNDQKSKLKLAMAYIQEGRVTGNHAYYDGAAMDLAEEVLKSDAKNHDGLSVKATILLSQHRFSEALTLAKQFVELYPNAAFGYGLLTDAHLELGNYKEAIAAADKMNAIRPDARSYSRIAYLREVHGDLDGAKKAMHLAVESGMIGLEQTEWSRIQLGKLYEMTGDTAKASQIYQQSLACRPNYAYALAGMGRLAKVNKQYETAINYFKQAAVQTTDYDFNDNITDCLQMINTDSARQNAEKVIAELKAHSHGETEKHVAAHTTGAAHTHDESGHHADKELAYAYLKTGNIEKALAHATIEWQRRPENIDVNECLGWCYFQNNEFEKAAAYIERALKIKSQNPILLRRAGEIFIKNGDAKRGNSLIKQALQVNRLLKTT